MLRLHGGFSFTTQQQSCPVSPCRSVTQLDMFPSRPPRALRRARKEKRKDGQQGKYDRSRTGRLGPLSLVRDQLGWVKTSSKEPKQHEM